MAPHDRAVVVAAHGVAFRYGARDYAVRDLTLDVHASDYIGIVGANGAGKTTLTRLLTGELAPTEGAIWFADGVSPGRDIALVSADPLAQLLTTSVFDEVAFALRARRLPRDEIITRTRETLVAFSLDGWEDRRPGDLSIGEQLRVLTAAAVARRPRLLILDEVASMIDGRNWSIIQRVVLQGQMSGAFALIVITHRLEDLTDASHALLLYAGAPVVEGPIERIFETALAHPAWRVEAPLAYATWRALDPRARARFASLWPARMEPAPGVPNVPGVPKERPII